jgi:hypothetical protein
VTDVLTLVVVLVCLAAILLGVLGRGRPAGGGALSGYRAPSTLIGLPAGLVAAVSATGLSNALLPPGGAAGAGVLVGAVFAILARFGSPTALRIAMGVFGVIGVVPAVLTVLEPTCSTVPAVLGFVTLGIIVVCTVLGALSGILRGQFRSHSVLALVAALRVMSFLASPMGLPLTGLPVPAWMVVCAAAAGFGYLAGRAPEVVIGIGALAIGLSAIAVSTTVGTACAPGRPEDAVTLICFVAAFGILRTVLRGNRGAAGAAR